MSYAGLGQYLAKREAPPDTRSAEAKRRSEQVSAWGIARQRMENDVPEDVWAAYRAAQDASGVDRGLIDSDARAEYQRQLAARRFGRVEANGHLGMEYRPGQVALRKVYRSELEDRPVQYAAVTGSSGDGWA